MKVFAAYLIQPAIGTKRDRITIVFFRTKLQAEIERDRMKLSDAKIVGCTVRSERPRVIASHLVHRFQGAALTLRHVNA